MVIMSSGTFARSYAPALRTITPANVGSNVQPGAQRGCSGRSRRSSIRAPLSGGSPSARLNLANRTRNQVERSLPGQIQFVDNLSDSLNTAAGDALYANALYIMLAVPGALIALGVAYLAALGTVSETAATSPCCGRAERRRDLLLMAGVESAVIGLVAGLTGSGLAFGRGAALVKRRRRAHLHTRPPSPPPCASRWRIAGAGAARIGSSESVLRRAGRRRSPRGARERGPPGSGYYLDLVALGAQRPDLLADDPHRLHGGGQPGLQPDPVAVVYMFFGPALLWIGATLLSSGCEAAGSSGWPAGVRGRAARLAARSAGQRRPPRARRSTVGWWWSGCCSPSASASASSRPPTTSRPGSTPS